MERENGTGIDTQGASPATESGSSSNKQAEEKTGSMADSFASAKAELQGEQSPKSDTEKPATDQEPKVTNEPKRKYKSWEDAEQANIEASRKITELSNELAQYKRAPKESAGQQDTQVDDDPSDQGKEDEEELEELTDEEYLELARADPLAARRYDQAMSEKRLQSKLAPLLSKAEQDAAIAREQQELQALEKLETKYDTDHGKGTFAGLQEQISNPETLKEIIENSPLKEVIGALVKSGDRVKTVNLLLREAQLFNTRRAEEKQRKSVPSGTGSGVSTKPNKSIGSMRDAFRAAKEEISR